MTCYVVRAIAVASAALCCLFASKTPVAAVCDGEGGMQFCIEQPAEGAAPFTGSASIASSGRGVNSATITVKIKNDCGQVEDSDNDVVELHQWQVTLDPGSGAKWSCGTPTIELYVGSSSTTDDTVDIEVQGGGCTQCGEEA